MKLQMFIEKKVCSGTLKALLEEFKSTNKHKRLVFWLNYAGTVKQTFWLCPWCWNFCWRMFVSTFTRSMFEHEGTDSDLLPQGILCPLINKEEWFWTYRRGELPPNSKVSSSLDKKKFSECRCLYCFCIALTYLETDLKGQLPVYL